MGCASSTIIAPSTPSPSGSRVETHPHQPPQVHRPPTSPVMRLVAALSVAVHPHHPPQVHRPPTSSMTRVVAPLSVAAPRYEHHLGPHHAAMPHRAPPLRRPLGHFRMMKTKKYGKSVTPPYGPWEHVPPHVWTDQSNSAATQDEAEDEAEVCVLCCQRRSTVAICDECKEHYCIECIDTHTCGTNVVC